MTPTKIPSAFLINLYQLFLFDDFSHLLMANSNEINTICECQYKVSDEGTRKTKDNFNNTNVHEIDEDESETEETASPRQLNLPVLDKSNKDDKQNNEDIQKAKDISDDESVYASESFCSDESSDVNEHQATNVILKSSFNGSSSLMQVADIQRNNSSKGVKGDKSYWKNTSENDEFCSLNDDPPRAIIMAKSKKCKRWNMTFTDEEMRKIERENELLLRKIMAQQKPRHNILEERTSQPRTSSSAINRKKLQKKIEDDNMLLLRRIQQAKSRVLVNASKLGCRLTFL